MICYINKREKLQKLDFEKVFATPVSNFKKLKTPVRHFCAFCFQWIYTFSKTQGPSYFHLSNLLVGS